MRRRQRRLTDAPDRLEPEQRDRIVKWAEAHAPSVAPHLGFHWAECRDWHLKHDEQAKDWEAAFRMWLRRAVQFEADRRDPAIRPRRTVTGSGTDFGTVIPLFPKA